MFQVFHNTFIVAS